MSETALQRFIKQALGYAPEARDRYDKLIQKKAGTSGKPIYDIERGKSLNPALQTLVNIAEVLHQPLELLTRAAGGESVDAVEWYERDSDVPPVKNAAHAVTRRFSTFRTDRRRKWPSDQNSAWNKM